MLIIWFALKMWMNGRRALIHQTVIMIIESCHSDFSMLSAVFQALINNVLRDMISRFVFVYLDDILPFTSCAPKTFRE